MTENPVVDFPGQGEHTELSFGILPSARGDSCHRFSPLLRNGTSCRIILVYVKVSNWYNIITILSRYRDKYLIYERDWSMAAIHTYTLLGALALSFRCYAFINGCSVYLGYFRRV